MEDLQEEMDRVRIFCLTKQLELQEVLKNVVGGEQLCLMYSQLLQNYANVKKEYFVFGKRYDDLAASHSAAVSKLEHSQVRNTLFNLF